MNDNSPNKDLPNSVPEIKNVYTKFYEMVDEYNKVDHQTKKEYLSLVTGWLMHEKDTLIYKENSVKK